VDFVEQVSILSLEPLLFLLDQDSVSDVDEHDARILAAGRWPAPALDPNGCAANDAWAAGLRAGLVADLWNTRLIPRYSLAAFLLVGHLGCGLRDILLAHRCSSTSANRIAFGITGIGVALATVITVAMLGVHIA
jgi:hypothetical protein